jgi:tetratricopeptide (TPR) repeat protein
VKVPSRHCAFVLAGVMAGMCTPADAQSKSASPGQTPMSAKDSAALRDKARAALAAGDLEAAGQLVDRTRGVVTPSERTGWWLIESELEFHRKQYAKSALAAMQIVILHPKCDQAGAALYWAGRSYEGLGRVAKAAELFQESLANRKTPKGFRDEMARRLDTLRNAEPK